MSKKVKRLFSQFSPEHYDLQIKISEDKLSFSGSVTVSGKRTGRPSERLTLHQKGLKLSNPKVIHTDKKGLESEIQITRTVKQKTYDEVRLHSGKTIYPGQYTISMDFSGKITNNMDGIYPCLFKEDGKQKKLIATQFESHHAREVFPCIDEPEAKATFQLDLTHAKDEIALSNTPLKTEKTSGKSKTSKFEITPVMSTYLLAFVVGEIEYKEAKSKNGVKIRTYATKDQVKHTNFALDIAVKCMDFYKDYYDIPFPLKKCDFIALPDFASGAMENWGLITFREQALLCDEKYSSLSARQWVALVVAHELTHQWFGNLVTMRWWTDLWLNEGFASWMEYLAIDHIYPEWKLWTQFAVDEQQSALKADALEHTHPIEVEINHPDEIRSIFDTISYQKGASAIHMLQNYLGAEGFQNGLRHYLKTHSYKNTDTIDLWQALEDKTNKPVKEFMHSWTANSGFPILQIETKSYHLHIAQSRFVANPDSKARDDKTLWPAPLLSTGLAGTVANKPVTNVPFSGKKAPIKINDGQTGLYRVNYSHEMQQKQLQALDEGKLSDIDRMGLLSDSFEVTKAGYQPVSEYLDLLMHFKNEDSLSVWEIIASSIGAIRNTLSVDDSDEKLRELLKPLVVNLVQPQLNRLGWDKKDNENHLDTLLRPVIVGMAAGSDDKPIVEKAHGEFEDTSAIKNSINPDLRSTVYATVARLGDKKIYDKLLDMYEKTTSAEEKLSLTGAMTNFKQPDIHKLILELIKSDTIRSQDTMYWLAYSLANRHSRALTWQWIQDNWSWIKENLGSDLSFSRMPLYAGRVFADDKSISSYSKFFEANMEPALKRTYNQGLEIAQTNAAWRKRDSKSALNWFI